MGVLRRLCSAAGVALRARGAGVTLMADGGVRGVSVASDSASAQLEDLQ